MVVVERLDPAGAETAEEEEMAMSARAAQSEGKRPQSDVHTMSLRLPGDLFEALRTYAFVTDAPSMNDVVLRALRDLLAQQGRAEEIEALLKRTTERYQVAFDKLADL